VSFIGNIQRLDGREVTDDGLAYAQYSEGTKVTWMAKGQRPTTRHPAHVR
jgi:hypothetical protein